LIQTQHDNPFYQPYFKVLERLAGDQ